MAIKKPYEISLWEDVVKYVGVNGVEYDSISEMSVAVDYQYYTERRIVTLGSDTMTSSLARAISPVYTRNVNGTETLTFEMYYQYEEPETGEIVHNPIIDLVIDERKIKLKYEVAPDDLWHEFIVKKNDERARDNKYSFTCTGLAANELGKTGFNIEFNVDLENNIGTVDELAQVVLDGSDWQLDTAQTELIQQKNNEALYKIYLGTSLTGTSIRDDSVTRTIAANSIIYAYYTPYANKEEDYFQFIYTTNTIPALLEDGITIHCNDTDTFDLYCAGVEYNDDGVPTFVRYTSGVANVSVAQYRGDRYVRKQLSHYDPVLEQTVGIYSKNGVSATKDYYGYSEIEYLGVDSVTNYIYNSTGYTATNYWNMYDESNGSSLSQITYPDVGPNNVRDDTGFASYLKVKFANINARLKNDGILQNYNRINRFEHGQQYVFRIKINQAVLDSSGKITSVVPITSNSPINCKIVKYNPGYVITGDGTVTYFNFTSFTNDEGYLRAIATCAVDVNWNELGKQIGIFIIPVNAALNNTYLIEDAQFYRYVVGDNNQPLRINDVPVNRVRTNWHFYDPELNLGKINADDYVYDGTNPANYTAKYGTGDAAFEKKRSITASESNRFNLLQELSETFECWVRFKIYHDLDGTITVEKYDYYKPVDNVTEQTYTQYFIYDQNTRTYVTPTEYDENKQYYEKIYRKRQKKRVYFYESVTSENYIGFKYGINLKDVNRVLDSEQIATKIIVKDNTREEAPNGFCSIARAEDNPIRENFAINLDYYTSQGIINKSNLDNDIYLENVSGSIGLYPRLARLNQERNSLIEEQAELSNNITNERAQVQTHKLKLDEATDQLSKLLDPESGTLKRYSGFVYDDFGNQYIRTTNHVIPAYGSTIYYIKAGTVSAISPTPSIIVKRTTDTEKQSGKTYYIINSNHQFEEWQQTRLYTTHIYYEATTGYAAGNLFQTTAGTTTLTITGSGSPDVRIYMAYAQITHSDEDPVLSGTNLYYSSVVEVLTKIKTYIIQKADSQREYDVYNPALEDDLERLDIIKGRLKEIEQGTEEVEREFNVKYARYIQEGSWTDDNYIDDNLYYLDALNVLYQSAYPKVTYNISVLELSQLEGYEAYKFDLGHKTFIEDIEFFGWKLGQVGYEPAKEWVVVTESKFDLDNNDKNNLKVQNYKSHFEDLFQRITAATQSLEYHTGEYQKAAAAVTPEGAINEVAMQRSFATAAFVIQNSHDQSVTWDDTGLQAVNLSDPAQIVRLASGGILVSTDGGQTWGVAITGYGVNANYIYAGTIDTENVNIMSGAFPTFKWDGTGLHAFAFSKDNTTDQFYSYDASRFVTFDRFGIYGTNGLTSTAGFDSVEDVEANADYALTWNGLFIRSKHRDGYTSISPYDDITLVDTSGNSEVVRAQLGQLIYDPITGNELNNTIFGLVLRDQTGNPTVVTQDDGTLWLLDSMRIGTAGQTNIIYIGVGEQDLTPGANRYKVINVNDLNNNEKFVVYSDGTLSASGVNIEGHIDATSGTIGGLSIDELVKSTGVRILAESGDTFKVDIQGNVIPEQLVFSCNSSIEGDTATRVWSISSDLDTWTELDRTAVDESFILSYTDASDYFTDGICYLRLQVTTGGRTYSDILTLKLDTVDDKYRINVTEETILKFPLAYNYNNDIYNWSLSLNQLEIKVIDLSSNTYIPLNNNVELTIEIREGLLLQYLQNYDESLENLDKYLSINSSNTGWILDLGTLLEDFPNTTFWNTTNIQFIRFSVLLKNEGNVFNLTKNVFVQVGTTEEMATLAINANGINMAIANAKLRFSQTGLTIENGGLEILATSNGETYRALTFDEDTGNLVITGDIYANDGEFSGIIHARDGEFYGTIVANAGYIGGFTIGEHSIVSDDGSLGLYSSYTDGGDLVESRINVKNIDIGTGARIAQYLQIGNLRLLNPETAESHQNVLELKDQETGTNYFTLTNAGEIIGNNWHIAKNGNGEVEAEFDLLRVNDGYFKGTINATDGNFSGIIDASVINATTINAVNFNSERLRSMGGAFIFRPNIPIARELTTADTDHIYVVITDSEYYPYFGYNEATSSYNGAIGEIVLLGGENIDVSAITNGTTSRYGKIDDIEILPIEGSEDYYLQVSIDVGDNVTNIPESAFEYYKNIMLFGKPTDENNKGDIVIGINSDNNTATKFLPKHSLTMAHFSDLIGDTFSQTYVDPQIKLLLGELDSLHKTYVNGYGLYAENVFLTGSLITEYTYNKENLNENNPTYAGVNTTDDNIRLRKDTEASYGRTYFNPNGTLERPIFWGGARGLSEEAINQAPLILTDQGNIYAMSGVFSGAIISNSVISETVLKAPVIYGTNKQDGVSLKLVNTTEFGQSGNFGGIGFYELVGELDSYDNNTSINEYIYGVNYQIVDVLIKDKNSNEIVDADIYFLDERSIKIVLKEQYDNTLIVIITSFDNETNTLYEDRFETKNYESNDLLTLLITSNGFYHYYNSNLKSEDPKSIKFIDFSRGSEFISFNGNKLMLENTTFVDNKISRASSSILLDNGSKMVLAYSTGAVEVGAEGVHCTGAVQTMDKQVVFADGVRMSYRKTGNYYCLYVEDE